MKVGFSRRTRINAYERLARALDQEYQIRDLLQLLYNHETNHGKRRPGTAARAFRDWHGQMAAGRPFWLATRDWVPPSHMMMIRAAEPSGRIAEALRACLRMDRAVGEMKTILATMFIYPGVLLTMIGFMYFFFGKTVFPRFESLLPVHQWAPLPKSLHGAVGFVTDGGALVTLVIMIAMMMVCSWLLPRWHGKARMIADALPPFSTYKVWNGVTFLFSLASYMRAGDAVTQALGVMEANSQPWMRHKIRDLMAALEAGQPLGEAFFHCDPDFPERGLNMELRLVTQLKNFEQRVDELAEQLLQNTLERFNGLANLVRGLGLMANAALLGWLILGIMSLTQQIQSGY